MAGIFYQEKDFLNLLEKIVEQSDITLIDFLEYSYSNAYGDKGSQKINWFVELHKHIYYTYLRPQKEGLINEIPVNIGRTELWIKNKQTEIILKTNNTDRNVEFAKHYVLWLERKYNITDWSDEVRRKYATWDNLSEYNEQLSKPDKGPFEKLYLDAVKFGDLISPKEDWKQRLQYLEYESGFTDWLQRNKGLEYGDKVHYNELMTEELFCAYLGFRENIITQAAIKFEEIKKQRAKLKTKNLPKEFGVNVKIGTFNYLYKGTDAKERIAELRKDMIAGEYIDKSTTLLNFKKIFRNEIPSKRIIWTGIDSELSYFIKQLHNEQKIVKDLGKSIWKVACNCFVKNDGSEFDSQKLSWQKIPVSNKKIEKLVSQLK